MTFYSPADFSTPKIFHHKDSICEKDASSEAFLMTVCRYFAHGYNRVQNKMVYYVLL